MNIDPNSDVTVTITSCNRFDLLQQTLDSFLSLNTYPLKKILISEDSTKVEMKNKILSKYGDKIELIFNEVNLGLVESLDNLYSKVDTKYIFHMEDDWLLSKYNNFIQESKDVLEERLDLHQVWIRTDVPADWIESEIYSTSTNINYKIMKQQHCGNWCGYSWNIGLRRLSDHKNIFPNGLKIHKVKSTVFSEHACNLHAASFGYRAALLNNGVCKHIGNGRTTI